MVAAYLYLLLLSFFLPFVRSAPLLTDNGKPVSSDVFESLEELARIVDISYCVGSTGIQKPFKCLGRCYEFEGFDLVTTWNTGPLLSDSCGYIAVSHAPFEKRVLVVFRGTYSIANTIADLSTRHAEYLPFLPGNNSSESCVLGRSGGKVENSLLQSMAKNEKGPSAESTCTNCTIHSGFWTSWQNTRCTIIPHVEKALQDYPDYKLVLVGHSLGGAVAAIAALELEARGYSPYVTTFGEPRIGNRQLNQYIDRKFNLNGTTMDNATFRRVTHVDDPVPLLPLEEWGYEMHAGEIYISNPSLPPGRKDVHVCIGDADATCIAGGSNTAEAKSVSSGEVAAFGCSVPDRYKLWQLFFAHRDYFWRLGLCVPGGDPWDWHRGRSVQDSNSHEDEL
ncbi:hypothetical protein LTR64_007403 [Lithohypha guttulata]|uniref:uncharacterized protein n=1 Tax=Lithohypha guttulata TaxID=1690604 RepID=UPI00315DDAF0